MWKMTIAAGLLSIYSGSANSETVQDAVQACAFLKDNAAVIACWTRYVTQYPRCEICFAHLGRAYMKNGEYNNAIASYSRSIELNPKYLVAMNSRGQVYEKLGRIDLAIADYRAAVAGNQNYEAANENLGRLTKK